MLLSSLIKFLILVLHKIKKSIKKYDFSLSFNNILTSLKFSKTENNDLLVYFKCYNLITSIKNCDRL